MVSVSVTPRRGNSTKFFPHSGHLGLSPVIVAGTLKLEWAEDENNVEVAEVLVRLRCYEAAGGQAQIHEHTVSGTCCPDKLNLLWETVSTAWSASDASLTPRKLKGDYQTEIKLIIPRSATDNHQHGFAVGSMTYKNWKSWWQLEAGTLTHHQGSSCDPAIKYSLSHPAQVSCGDIVTVNVSLRTGPLPQNQLDRAYKLKKVILTLERNFTVDTALIERANSAKLRSRDTENSSSTSILLSDPSSQRKDQVVPRLRYTQSLGKLRSKARSPSRPPSDRKTVVSVIQLAEIPIAIDDQDRTAVGVPGFAWNGRVDLVVPRPKSAYHYSIGDSCKTKFVSVTYHLKAQVVIKTRKGNNTEIVNLGSSEVGLSSVPTLDRETACRNYKKLVHNFGTFKETVPVFSTDSQSDTQIFPKVVTPSTLTV